MPTTPCALTAGLRLLPLKNGKVSTSAAKDALNKLSSSHYRGACDAQNLGSIHAHTIGLPHPKLKVPVKTLVRTFFRTLRTVETSCCKAAVPPKCPA